MSISSLPANLKKITKHVRLLGDRILVKPLEYKHPTLYVAGIHLNRGVVVAVGPGRRCRRKVRFDHSIGHLSTSKSLYFEDGDETGKSIEMDLQVGDVVEYSFRNQVEWEFMGEKMVIVRRKACYGTPKDAETSNSLLWQQSAGYDRHGNFLPDQGHEWSDQ